MATEISNQPIIKEVLRKCEQVNILVTGRSGAGKSSLINAIIGKEIVIEGKDLKGKTQYVTSYSTEINGVQYNIWDSSGLQDRGITDKVILDNITTQLVQKCTHIHLLVHCLRMDTDRIEKNDELAIMRLTDIFGPKIWDMSVIALTYANKVEPPPDSDEDSAMRETFFKQRPIDYREKIIKILIKCQLNKQKASEIAVIPTGYHKPTRNRPNPYKVLDIEDWLNPFWITCAERMKETALGPLIRTQRELGDKLLPDPELRDEVTELPSNRRNIHVDENSGLWQRFQSFWKSQYYKNPFHSSSNERQETEHKPQMERKVTEEMTDGEIEELTERMKDKVAENESLKNELFHLKEKMKIKDAENTLLQKDAELLIKEKQTDKITIEHESIRLEDELNLVASRQETEEKLESLRQELQEEKKKIDSCDKQVKDNTKKVKSKQQQQCSSCSINKTMNKQLLQEIDTLHQEQTTLHQEQTTLYSQTDELQLTVKTKDGEIEELTEQMKDKVSENESLKNELFHLKEKMKIKDAENTPLQKDVELLIKEKQTDKITIGDTTDNTALKKHIDNERTLDDYDCLVSQLQMEKEMKKKMMLELEGITALQKLNDPVNITKTFSDVGVQFDYSVPVSHDHINGAYIAGRISYTIQGSKAQSLNWDDYGLKMHFPQDTLQHDDNCEVAILALAGGNFRFPKGTELVSAVYAISFQKKINQPVGVDMEHCVALETEWQTTQLHFVATEKGHSQNNNVFDFIEGGQFQIGNKYGYLEQMHFCENGVVKETSNSKDDGTSTKDSEGIPSTESNGRPSPKNKYIGFLLYETRTFNRHWLLQFFVYKDIKVYEKFIEKKCGDKSEVDERIVFSFIDSYIELILSPDTVPNGWSLRPHSEPLQITQSDVDIFGSSPSNPPSCMITIDGIEGTRQLLHHPITLSGIECCKKKIFIIRSIVDEIPSATIPGSTPISQQLASNPLTTSISTDPDSITRLVSIIKDVFNNNIADLNTLLQNNINEFARGMLQEQLIAPVVSRNPNYKSVSDNFLSTLAFMAEQRLIEQQCSKFLKVLHNIGGHYPSESMRNQLTDTVKTRLNIDLHLDPVL